MATNFDRLTVYQNGKKVDFTLLKRRTKEPRLLCLVVTVGRARSMPTT